MNHFKLLGTYHCKIAFCKGWMNKDIIRRQSWVVQRTVIQRQIRVAGVAGKAPPPTRTWALALASFGNVYWTTYQWCEIEPRHEEGGDRHFPAITASSHFLWRMLPKNWSSLIKMLRRLISVCGWTSFQTPM